MSDPQDDDSEEMAFEYMASFEGPCTCTHEQEDHGWGSCNEDDCLCEAGWVE